MQTNWESNLHSYKHDKFENQILIQTKIDKLENQIVIQSRIKLRLRFILFDKSILKTLLWYLLTIILQAANQQVCMGVQCGRFTADMYMYILILIYLLIYICILILIYYLFICTMYLHLCSPITALDKDFNQVHELWLLRSLAKIIRICNKIIIIYVWNTRLSYNHGSKTITIVILCNDQID